MTTATKEPPDTDQEQERVWTLREVAKQEGTLEDLRTKLADLAEQEADLRARIADAVADGDDPAELREELAEVRDLRDDLEGVEPVLEERIAERRLSALRTMASERLQSIKKRAGGVVGEFTRQVDRAEEYRDRYLQAATYVQGAPVRLRLLKLEAQALADLFDLEPPELKQIPRDEAKRGEKVAAPTRRPTVGHESLTLSISRNLSDGEPEKAARTAVSHLDTLFGEDDAETLELLEALEA